MQNKYGKKIYLKSGFGAITKSIQGGGAGYCRVKGYYWDIENGITVKHFDICIFRSRKWEKKERNWGKMGVCSL